MIHRQACIIGSLDVGKVRLRRIMLKSHHFGVIFGGKTNFWTLKYLQIPPKKVVSDVFTAVRINKSSADYLYVLHVWSAQVHGRRGRYRGRFSLLHDRCYHSSNKFPSYWDSMDMIWTESILLLCS